MTEREVIERMEIYRTLCRKLGILPVDEYTSNHYHWVMTGAYKLMTFEKYSKRSSKRANSRASL